MNVSNKAVHAYINYIIENHDDPRVFFEKLGYDYSIISDEKKYMSWSDYRTITEKLNSKYDKFYEGMTRHGLTNKFVKQVLEILSKVIRFSFVGDFILKYSFKTFYTDALKVELLKTGRTTFDIVITFERPSDIFPVFVDMYKDVFLALPKLVSKSLSWEVKASQEENILIYHIDEKMSKPSFFTSFQIFILTLFKLDKYYQNLIIENLQHTNDLERKNLELEMAEKEIIEANKELLLANRIIGHDIANKMVIVEQVKSLLKRDEIKKASDKLDLYYNSVKAIIENTRGVIDENSYTSSRRIVPVKEILDELVFEYEDQASAKSIKVSLILEEDNLLTILTNKEALKVSVLGNLLQNAIKFSKENSEIIINSYVKDNYLYITCEDFGVGMTPELVNDINSNVEQLFKSTVGTHGETGRGLGLFIIKKVGRELGFNVEFKSELGTGTKAILTKQLNKNDKV